MVRPPRATGDTLLDLRQGRLESTRTFVQRFVQAARRVQTCSEELALAAIRRGLLKGGPGTLRFDAHKREFRTLQEFVAFADGYIRAEEDAGNSDKSRSPSPQQKYKNSGPKENPPRGSVQLRQEIQPRREEQSKGDRNRKGQEGSKPYRPRFTSYAEMTMPRKELFTIVINKFKLPKPLDTEQVEVRGDDKWCEFHRSRGHSTGDCFQLKDILETLVRQGDLSQYINKEFFRQHASRYNGKDRKYKIEIPPKPEHEDHQYRSRTPREEPDEGQDRRQRRRPTPTIIVISGGIASGGDTRRERRQYLRNPQAPAVLSVESLVRRKRPRTDEVISF